jgi:hypothetical protein
MNNKIAEMTREDLKWSRGEFGRSTRLEGRQGHAAARRERRTWRASEARAWENLDW